VIHICYAVHEVKIDGSSYSYYVVFLIKLQAEGSETYVWLGSQPTMECSGCSELRKQVEDLRSMMSDSVQQRDDGDRCHSTCISEHKQTEIDEMLLNACHKAETFKEAYEKVKNVVS